MKMMKDEREDGWDGTVEGDGHMYGNGISEIAKSSRDGAWPPCLTHPVPKLPAATRSRALPDLHVSKSVTSAVRRDILHCAIMFASCVRASVRKAEL